MTMFDGYIMVDWSATNKPTPLRESENAIWTAHWINNESNKPEYHRTRVKAYNYLINLLDTIDKASKNKQRLLIGFDFAFGYPYDSYDGFGCKDWEKLWKLINTEINDSDKNENNRFIAGGILNKKFKNKRPFWGHPPPENNRFDGLSYRKPKGYGDTLPSEFRIIEKMTRGASSVWQLFGAGCVGSQTLMGIHYLQKLRECTDCAIWPFEDINNNKHVIAEIYPSIWHPENHYPIKDANQVYTVAKNIANFDKHGTLKNLLQAPHRHSRHDDITKKEGWMLGVDETGKIIQCP